MPETRQYTVYRFDELPENAKEICSKLYKDLEKECEYRTSDETLTEYFTHSDYLFTEKGVID